MKKAIILAGGKGTRLKPITENIPKALVEINKKPIIEYIFDNLISYNFNEVILAVGYKAKLIINKYKNTYKNLKIKYSIEKKPLLTGGALKKALNIITNSEYIYIFNGDIITNCNLNNLYNFHKKNKSFFTIATTWKEKADRFGLLNIDNSNKIIDFIEKKQNSKGYINIGIYLASVIFLKNYLKKFPDTFSLEKNLFPELSKKNLLYAFKCENIKFIDIGTKKDFEYANKKIY